MSFCRADNLAALLRDESKLTVELKAYESYLWQSFDPLKFKPWHNNAFQDKPLSTNILEQLVRHLNAANLEGCSWLPSSNWNMLSSINKEIHAPVVSHANFIAGLEHTGVLIKTCRRGEKSRIVQVVSCSNGAILFVQIISIFTHQCFPTLVQPPVSKIWLIVEYFAPVPS